MYCFRILGDIDKAVDILRSISVPYDFDLADRILLDEEDAGKATRAWDNGLVCFRVCFCEI